MFLLSLFCIILIKSVATKLLSEPMLEYCLKNQPNPSVLKCFGQQALHTLQTIDDIDNYTLTNGLLMIKSSADKINDNSPDSRSIPNIFVDQDPMDIRGILENAGAIVGKRTLQWDMDMIHPGLCLRIGPSVESNSVLEFIMDPNHDRGDRYYNGEIGEPSTARILTKQFVLPFLLGLKFNLITILPLVFAGIILLCKKAAFLGKIAIFITGLLGFGSLFSFGGGGGLGGLGGLSDLFGGGGGTKFHNNHHGGGGYGSYGHDYPLSGGYYKMEESKNLPTIDGHKNNNNNNNKQSNHQEIDKGNNKQYSIKEPSPPLVDNFYNYEKKMLFQERNTNLYPREMTFGSGRNDDNGGDGDDGGDAIAGAEPRSTAAYDHSINNYRDFGWRSIRN